MADPDPPDSASPSMDVHGRGAPLVLMADRAEGSVDLTMALQGAGLSVFTCDVVALPERAARLSPFAIVIDVERPNVAPVVARLLEMAEVPPLIAAIGTAESAERLQLAHAPWARRFPRPLAVHDLVRFLTDHIPRAPDPPRSSSAGSSPGTGIGTGVGPTDSDAMLSDFHGVVGMPEVEGILPELDGGPISTKIAGQLSPEIEALLATSALRVREQDQQGSPPLAEQNVLVPPEMLALVDDLLNADDPPATRGGMDLSGMFAGPSVRESGISGVPPPGPSSHGVALDSQPSWHTGVPVPGSSDIGSSPTGLVSDHGDGTGVSDRDRQSDPPGTSIGLGEETSVPGGGTQVGYSSPLEPGPAPEEVELGYHGPSAVARPERGSGSSPPVATELRTYALATQPLTESEAPADLPPSFRGSEEGGQSSPPPRTEHYAAHRPGGPVRLGGSDGPPDSVLATSELAPRTTAGMPTFSSRHPEPAVGLDPRAGIEVMLDSRESVRGDPFDMLAGTVRRRLTGALVLSSVDGTATRRVLMRDGDMVNAASEHEADALVHFLVQRGDLSPEVAQMRSARLPHTGRHAAAALIANGFLGQDDLWPVLRAHAEWIIGRALIDAPAVGHLEREPPERLRAEPNVFGGAAGVEVYIEAVCRVVSAEDALARLGGPDAVLGDGPSRALLAESALSNEHIDRIRAGTGQRLGVVLGPRLDGFEAVVFALVMLRILTVRAPSRRPDPAAHQGIDPLDADAVRQRVRARMALVQEADYFSLLGVPRAATGYEIRRAFVELRRVFEPARLLTAATADLHDDVMVIVEVLEEAYQILRDPHRRSRYRRAIEAVGPASAHP